MTFYSADDNVTVAPIPFEGRPAVAENFDLPAVQASAIGSPTEISPAGRWKPA